jgi:uncharacterized protein (TIGR03066 family)
MKAIASTVLLLVALVLGHADARAQASALVGAWDVTAMEIEGKKRPMPAGMSMTVAFTATGTVTLTMRSNGKDSVQPATYVVKGDEVHITMDGKTDRLKYGLGGSTLTLSKVGTTEVLHLIRASARP